MYSAEAIDTIPPTGQFSVLSRALSQILANYHLGDNKCKIEIWQGYSAKSRKYTQRHRNRQTIPTPHYDLHANRCLDKPYARQASPPVRRVSERKEKKKGYLLGHANRKEPQGRGRFLAGGLWGYTGMSTRVNTCSVPFMGAMQGCKFCAVA